MVVEDADRLTDQAANALLKAIEEPTERTVWLLCAPTVEDVLPTIRSRTRLVVLATPSVDDVTDFLVRAEGLAVETASYAARASQGHIGRARALARDEDTRRRRREVVAIPGRLDVARRLHAPRPRTCTTSPRRRPTRSPASTTSARRPSSTGPTASSSAVGGRASTPPPCATWRSRRRPGPSGATSTWSTAG